MTAGRWETTFAPLAVNPLDELDVYLAAASEADRDSVRAYFVAKARVAYAAARKHLDQAERVLVAQEADCSRVKP